MEICGEGSSIVQKIEVEVNVIHTWLVLSKERESYI